MRAVLGTLFAKGVSNYLPEIRCRMPADAEKRLYLTFDDGPTPDGTPHILDILGRLNVSATFFLVGRNAVRFPELVRAIDQAGHAIGSHSYGHLDAWRASSKEVLRDLSRGVKTLEDQLGAGIRWVRPPFGRITRAIVRWSRRKGQQILLWDNLPADFARRISQQRVARNMASGLRPGSVICLHDNSRSFRVTPAALVGALPRLLDAGWKFSAVE